MGKNMLRRKYYQFFYVVILAFSLPGYSYAGEATAKITYLFSGPGFGTRLFIGIDAPVNSKPACSISSYSFSVDTSEPGAEVWVSMLMTAYSTGKPIRLEGKNSCNLWGSIEDLNYLRLNP